MELHLAARLLAFPNPNYWDELCPRSARVCQGAEMCKLDLKNYRS